MSIIYVRNLSTKVTDDILRILCLAAQSQMNMHASPAWNTMPPLIDFCASEGQVKPPDRNNMRCDFRDAADVPGAGAYHDNLDDCRSLRIFMEECDTSPSGVFGPNGAGRLFTHEILEAWMDQFCNTWIDGSPLPGSKQYALEIADPVQGGTYPVIVSAPQQNAGPGSNHVVMVSNFVTPAWFDNMADESAAPFDFARQLSSAFTVAPQGYCMERDSAGVANPVWGALVTDEMKAKILSRHRVRGRMKTKRS